MTTVSITPVTILAPAATHPALQQPVAEKPNIELAAKTPFQPAPALRPTIEDKIDIDRALILMREG